MRKPLPAALLVAAALAGCGGDDQNRVDGGSRKNTVVVGHNQPIAFGADEYSFEPKKVTVKSGTTAPTVVRFALRNNGTQAHDLRIQRDGEDLGGTPVFGPDRVESGQAKLSPGTYQFICTVGDHAARGMRGTLIVTSEKTTRPKDPDAGEEGEREGEGGGEEPGADEAGRNHPG